MTSPSQLSTHDCVQLLNPFHDSPPIGCCNTPATIHSRTLQLLPTLHRPTAQQDIRATYGRKAATPARQRFSAMPQDAQPVTGRTRLAVAADGTADTKVHCSKSTPSPGLLHLTAAPRGYLRTPLLLPQQPEPARLLPPPTFQHRMPEQLSPPVLCSLELFTQHTQPAHCTVLAAVLRCNALSCLEHGIAARFQRVNKLHATCGEKQEHNRTYHSANCYETLPSDTKPRRHAAVLGTTAHKVHC